MHSFYYICFALFLFVSINWHVLNKENLRNYLLLIPLLLIYCLFKTVQLIAFFRHEIYQNLFNLNNLPLNYSNIYTIEKHDPSKEHS